MRRLVSQWPLPVRSTYTGSTPTGALTMDLHQYTTDGRQEGIGKLVILPDAKG